MKVNDIIINIGYLLLLINLVLYLRSYKRNSKAFKVICIYLGFTFLIQLITAIYAFYGKNNLYISHYYFIGQFTILSYFYFLILKKTIHQKIIKLIFITVVFILFFLFLNSPKVYFKFSLLEVVICSIPLVLYAFFYFYESFGVKDKFFLFFNSGVFFYLLSAALIFSTGNYLISSKSSFVHFLYHINTVLYVIFQLFIFVEWYQNFRKKEPISIDNIDPFIE